MAENMSGIGMWCCHVVFVAFAHHHISAVYVDVARFAEPAPCAAAARQMVAYRREGKPFDPFVSSIPKAAKGKFECARRVD